MKLNDFKSTLEIYQKLLETLPNKAPGLQTGEIHFRIGKTYVQLREYSLALEAFNRALEEPNGESETKPLVYFHMAQIHDERGEKAQALEYYQQVLNHAGPQEALEDTIKEVRRKLRRLRP